MSLLTDILKEAPLSAVLQEKVKTLEAERDDLNRQLDDSRRLYQVLQADHQKLVALHAEDTKIHNGIEFRRGERTGSKWLPFCPKCHAPAIDCFDGGRWHGKLGCSAGCGWHSNSFMADFDGLELK